MWENLTIRDKLVLADTAFLLLILVFGAGLYSSGTLSTNVNLLGTQFVVTNVIFGIIYFIYTMKDKELLVGPYEATKWSAFSAYMFIGFTLHFVFFFILPFLPKSVISASQYFFLLSLAVPLIGLTENSFFVIVLPDFVYNKTNSTTLAVLSSALVAALYHAAVPSKSWINLLSTAFWFGWWTYASIKSGSSLYADIHHVVGNAIGFAFLTVPVV